jgi:PAS domain S-box-containing protein
MGLTNIDKDQLLSKLMGTSCMLVYIFDVATRTPYFRNGHITDALDYTEEQVKAMGGKVLETLLHPDDWAKYSENISQVLKLKDGEEISKIDRYRKVDGSYRWFKNTRTVFSRNTDGTVKETLGIIQEISSEIESLQKLHDTENKFKALFNSTTDFNFFVDAEMKVLTLNLAAINYVTKFTGVKIKEGDSLKNTMTATMMIDADAVMQKALKGEVVEVLKDYDSPNGDKFWFKAKFFPVYDDTTKQMIGVQINVRDFTKTINTSVQLELQNKQLKEIARINSHEIRRPLANILGIAEMLRRSNHELPEDIESLLMLIQQSSHELDEIVRRIVSTAYVK